MSFLLIQLSSVPDILGKSVSFIWHNMSETVPANIFFCGLVEGVVSYLVWFY